MKISSNDDGVQYTGTMVDRGAVSQSLNAGGSYTISAGRHNGSGKVTANSLASQTSGTAVAGDILSGKTAWVNGVKLTGSIASLGAQTVVPGNAAKTVSTSGKYMTGNVVVNAVANLTAANVKKGVTVGGVAGIAPRSTVVNNVIYNAAVTYTGYSDTASSRAISVGSQYADWDTLVLQIEPVTDYCGPITVAISKGKDMRVPITTIKYSDGIYQQCWVSLSRSSAGEIKIAPFRGNVSGTYTTKITVLAVFDGLLTAQQG